MTAETFGACVCGQPKAKHSEAARNGGARRAGSALSDRIVQMQQQAGGGA